MNPPSACPRQVLGPLCLLLALPALVACGDGHGGARGRAKPTSRASDDIATVVGALQRVGHIRMTAPKKERIAGLHRLWKDLPQKDRSELLLRVAVGKTHFRYASGACLAMAKPEWAARQALQKALDDGFAGDPGVVGFMIYWGSPSIGEAISRGRRLLARKNKRSRMAGHFILTVTTFRDRPPDPWMFSIKKTVDVPKGQWDFTARMQADTPDEVFRSAWADAFLASKKSAQGSFSRSMKDQLYFLVVTILRYFKDQSKQNIKTLASRG